MSVIRYQIVLKEPAIFARLEGEPNSAVSYDFIPGSALRGMLIGAYRRQYGEIDAADESIHHLFFSDATRFLNAYIATHGSDETIHTRLLPTPLSWRQLKYPSDDDSANKVFDSAFNKGQSQDGKSQAIHGFAHITDNKQVNLLKTIPRVLNVHTQRPRRGSHEGQLYRYDALAADLIFEGVILCEDDYSARIMVDLLSNMDTVTLGGARTAGYGRATIDNIQFSEGWPEALCYPQPSDNQVCITLLSDAILRDEYGVYRPTQHALLTALELNLDNLKPTWVQAILATEMVGGFNRKWGLPLPQTPALKRGSVLLLEGVSAASIADHFIEQGIGERRNEGFGRIAINWQYTDVLTTTKVDPATVRPETIALSTTSKAMWDRMEQRLRDRMLEEVGGSFAYSRDFTISGSITRTQIARLRTLIADELRKEHPQRTVLASFLADVRGKAAGNQFERARIGQTSLANWLQDPQFDLPASAQGDHKVTLKLVDAVLERAQKSRSGQDA